MSLLYSKSRGSLVRLFLFLNFFLAIRLSAQQTHISYFTPARASMGATVSIHGSGFTGTSYVAFGGYSAQSFTVYQDTMINAVVGHGGSGYVLVSGINGVDSLAGFSFSASDSPLIYSYAPRSGSPGTVVTISGTRLTGTTAVSFGGTAAASFTVLSDSMVRATVGYGSTGNVNVNTPFGIASAAGFTYVAPAGPTHITFFTPTTGKTGTAVQIHGNYFTGTSQVRFGGVNAQSFAIASDTLINATVGSGASGQVWVSGVNGVDSLGGFIYQQDTTTTPPPQILSFKPPMGNPGTAVTINGSHFTGATAVSFGGKPAASFTVVSDAQIRAIVGYDSSGLVTVTTPSGSASRPGFVFIPPPAPHIRYFSPFTGTEGTSVQIYGNYFTGANGVRFGGVTAASFSVVNDTLISATVGSGASGQVWVSTPRGADSLNGFIFQDSTRGDSTSTGGDSTSTGGDSTSTGGDSTNPRAFRLVSLTISAAGVQPELQWQTVYDESIADYEVEQSSDSVNYNPVGVVASQRTDSAGYTFTDSVARTGVNYYYLKIIDTAGNITSSPIVAIQMPLAAATLAGFPNPAVGSFYVPVPVSAKTSKITVTDMSGNVVRTIILPPNPGQVRIDVHGLNKGVYKVAWSDGVRSAYQSVLVW